MGRKNKKENKFTDKFWLSPIATVLFIISLLLAWVLGGVLWLIIAGFSFLWIIFRWIDYTDKKEMEKVKAGEDKPKKHNFLHK